MILLNWRLTIKIFLIIFFIFQNSYAVDPFFGEDFMGRIIEEFRRFMEQIEKQYVPLNPALNYRWIQKESKMVLVINYLPAEDEKIDLKIKKNSVEIYGRGKINDQELTFNSIVPIPAGLNAELAEVEFIRKGLIKIHFPLKGKKVPKKLTPVRPGKDDITI